MELKKRKRCQKQEGRYVLRTGPTGLVEGMTARDPRIGPLILKFQGPDSQSTNLKD